MVVRTFVAWLEGFDDDGYLENVASDGVAATRELFARGSKVVP